METKEAVKNKMEHTSRSKSNRVEDEPPIPVALDILNSSRVFSSTFMKADSNTTFGTFNDENDSMVVNNNANNSQSKTPDQNKSFSTFASNISYATNTTSMPHISSRVSSRNSNMRAKKKIFATPRKKFSFFPNSLHPFANDSDKKSRQRANSRTSNVHKKRKKRQSTYDAPTNLHEVCKHAKSIYEIHSYLSSTQYSSTLAITNDDEGRLPLHLFSMNKHLSDTSNHYGKHPQPLDPTSSSIPSDKSTLAQNCLIQYLLPSNPTSMTCKDKKGFIPFEYSLVEWVINNNSLPSLHDGRFFFPMSYHHNVNHNGSNHNHNGVGENSDQPPNSDTPKSFFTKSRSWIAKAGRTIQCTAPHPSHVLDKDFNSHLSDDGNDEGIDRNNMDSTNHDNNNNTQSDNDDKDVSFTSLDDGQSDMFQPTMENNTEHPHDYFPSGVRTTPHLMFTLEMLSTIVENLEKRSREEKVLKMNVSPPNHLNNPQHAPPQAAGKSFMKNSRGGNLSKSINTIPSPIATDLDAVFAKTSESTNANDAVTGGNICESSKNVDHTCESIRDHIIQTIASIPNFIKTLLLIEDDIQRKCVFDLPIIRHVVFDKRSIGQWLINMLKSKQKLVSKRAVDYLRLLSGEDERQNYRLYNDSNEISSFIHLDKFSSSGTNAARKRHVELYEAVSQLDGLIPSLLGLDERMIEQAATTHIVSRVLDRMVLKPFAVSVVFFDVIFLSILILSFRFSTNVFLEHKDPDTILKWIYSANACIIYFIIRELGKFISLSMFTGRSFVLSYFCNFWNMVDVLSTFTSLGSTILMRLNFKEDDESFNAGDLGVRTVLAIAIFLLWFRVLGLAKTINVQLATFVLAIFQIIRDIVWFLLILVVAVVCFAQMFHILLSPSICPSTNLHDKDDFCDGWKYYIKVYTILLGDYGGFEIDDFSTGFSIALAVLFTFMVVIVLLNVLIAIVSDSYEKCLLRSEYLFGRARVMLLAELVSFQHLLRPKKATEQLYNKKTYLPWSGLCWKSKMRRESLVFFGLCSFVIVSWIVGETLAFYGREHDENFSFNLGSLGLVFGLLLAIFFILVRGASGSSSAHPSIAKTIQWIMSHFIRTSADAWNVAHEQEWKGQVNYLQREMSRIANETTAHTRMLIQEEIRVTNEQRKQLERRIIDSEERIMAQIKETQRQLQSIATRSSF